MRSGQDPLAAGCGKDAYTVMTGNVGKVIRYSPHCQAAWARLTDGVPGDTAVITNQSGQRGIALIHWGFDAYSPMVDASGPGSTLRVCGQQPQGSACTLTLTDPAAAPSITVLPTTGTGSASPTPKGTPSHR